MADLWNKLIPLLGGTRVLEIKNFVETTGTKLDNEAFLHVETEDVTILTSTKVNDYIHKLCYVEEANTYVLHINDNV
jgi:hypothetical protein